MDGALTLVFTSIINHAKISAIEVVPAVAIPRGILTATPTHLSFGQQVIGTSTAQTVTLSNQGELDITALNLSLSGSHATEFSLESDCSAPMAPEATCTATVTYTPTTIGAVSATLSIAYHDGVENRTLSIALSGEGTSTPTYTLTITTVGNGTVIRDPDQATYPSGTAVQLTAMPAVGWVFGA